MINPSTRPSLSVLMSTYISDNSEHLKEALESIYDQTIPPDEIILVMDGEISAESLALLSETELLQGPSLKLIRLEHNVGLAKALNEGLAHCSGDIVIRMDADDVSLPCRIEENLSIFATHPTTVIAGGNYDIYNFDLTSITGRRNVPSTPTECINYARYRVPFNHPTIAFRRLPIQEMGGYPTDVGRFEDWGLAFKALHSGFEIRNTQKVLLKFRGGEGLIGRRSGFNYFLEEFRALSKFRQRTYITRYTLVANLLIRLPLRIMPVSFVTSFYSKILHK